jgi:hypothetical protein
METGGNLKFTPCQPTAEPWYQLLSKTMRETNASMPAQTLSAQVYQVQGSAFKHQLQVLWITMIKTNSRKSPKRARRFTQRRSFSSRIPISQQTCTIC